MKLRTVLQNVPDPRGKQGQDYFLWSILGLIVVSLLCGRRGMLAAFHLGRCLNKRQRVALGFTKGVTPCHATLTETLRAIDGRALAQALGAACCAEGEDQRHIAIDGKTMRASKDGDGHATHVLSAFCAGLQSILGNEASRGKGMEIPDALKLLDQLDLKDKIVTGDAMFCQKSIVAKIAEKVAATYFRSRTIRRTYGRISQRLSTSRFFPLVSFEGVIQKAHGRIERRSIDVLPANAAGIENDWSSVKQSAASRAFGKARRTANGRSPRRKSSI